MACFPYKVFTRILKSSVISPGFVLLSDYLAQRQAAIVLSSDSLPSVRFLLFLGQYIFMVMVIHLEVHPLICRSCWILKLFSLSTKNNQGLRSHSRSFTGGWAGFRGKPRATSNISWRAAVGPQAIVWTPLP